MAFNKMRRRPIEHGYDAQPIDMDFGWIQQGAANTSDPQTWQRYIGGAVASVGGAAIVSLQRTAAGTIKVYMDPTICGTNLINAWADVNSSKTGYVASYTACIGAYTAPIASTGSYNGVNAAPGTLVVYTKVASSGVLADISSLSLASVRVQVRWGDANY